MDLAKLKALLGIEDDSKDMVLEFVIADVEEIIKLLPCGENAGWIDKHRLSHGNGSVSE